jgi:hypothetical protein
MGESQARRCVRRNDFNFVSVESKTAPPRSHDTLNGARHAHGVLLRLATFAILGAAGNRSSNTANV